MTYISYSFKFIKVNFVLEKYVQTSLMILGSTGNSLEEWALLAWSLVSVLLRRKTTTDPQIRERGPQQNMNLGAAHQGYLVCLLDLQLPRHHFPQKQRLGTYLPCSLPPPSPTEAKCVIHSSIFITEL